MKIILGSKSKGRHGVLTRMGYEFEVMSADIDEKSIRSDDPKKLTLALANAKADALLPKIHEPSVLITSDQVVAWKNQIHEKPRDEKQARKWLRDYCAYPSETVTAVVIVNTKTGKRREGVDTAKIWLREIPEDIADKLIADGDIFTRAGGFSVENPVIKKYTAKIEGDVDSIIGLPVKLTERLIGEVQNK